MSAPARLAATRTASPYKGLDHYGEADAPFFYGRETECDLIVANILAARLTLLYGRSGVGKSSLLHADVVPRLRETPDLAVVIFRSWAGDPAAGLAAAIGAVAGFEPPASEHPLADTIALCTERLGCDLAVILDQFEEYFVYHPEPDGQGTFEAEFPRAVNRREFPASFLVSIREDALARLDRFKGQIPSLFGNYLRIDRLDRTAGREAIVRPLKEYERRFGHGEHFDIEPELVESVLDQVRVGNVSLAETGAGVVERASARESRIEAPYLQLVLTRLWEEETAAGSHILHQQTLDRLGGAERIVPEHLDAAMATLSPDERNLAARVFRFLVTPSGTKIAHRASDLAEYAEAPEEKVEPLLDRLSGYQARILRGTGDGYEIYHDVLAAPILDWRSRYLETIRVRRRNRILTIGLVTVVIFLGLAIGIGVAARQPAAGAAVGVVVLSSIVFYGAIGYLIFRFGVRHGRRNP
jgi:Novel STAND NTPase 1